MFQFVFVAVLFQLRARGPAERPLLHLPNRRATAQGDVVLLPYNLSFHFQDKKALMYSWGNCCAPPAPLDGYADRWKQKIGSTDVPVRMRGRAAPITSTRACRETVDAPAKPKGNRRDFILRSASIQPIAASH